MDIDELRVFQAVAHHLHFRRAADRLHMSPAALSSHIRKLEEQIGTDLFVRDKRTVVLTAAGEHLLANAEDLIQHHRALEESTRQGGKGEIGIVRIGFVSTASVLLVPTIVKMFRERHPGIRLHLRNLITSEQVDALNLKAIDAGILRLPLANTDVQAVLLHEEPFWVLLASGHKFEHQKSIKLEQLKDQPQVFYRRDGAPGYHDQIRAMLASRDLHPDICQEASDMYSLSALVAAGLGIAIIPRSVSRHHVAGVVAKPLAGRLPKAQLGLAFRRQDVVDRVGRHHSHRPALRHLEDICRIAFRQLDKT